MESNDQVFKLFPTYFYTSENVLNLSYLKHLQDKVYKIKDEYSRGGRNWKADIYNTLGTYDLRQDADFKILLDAIEERVFNFVKMHNSTYRYKIKESWFNIYNKGDYQEYHHHADCTFSAVFFLKSKIDSAKIHFESPLEPDMLPVKDIQDDTELTFKTCRFPPVENSLIIFRSYLKHMVEKETTDNERITIAVNL
tara:strand:- start:300 stop:887 length:588 start_codon:yes stop_codon:yes gene_type:complete